jgi:pimeloyl-ACP methyl ester carboxylesterase
MMAQKRQVLLADGRSLDVWVGGAPQGVPYVTHHGTPGSGLPYPPFVEEAARRGLRWISFSRPGYGGSTRRPGRSIADCASDVAAILDELGADRCYTMGGSGGGPHALACASLLPDRVIAAATVASVAPYGAEGLDFLEGMGPENVEEFGLALDDHDGLRVFMERDVATWTGVTAAGVADALGGLVSEVDRAAVTGDFAEALVRSYREATRNGIWGWFDDDIAFTREWGFELGSIRKPVTVWQGDHDLMVPPGHGRWLAERIPTARARLEPDHGHLSLAVASYGLLLDELVASAET